MEVTVVVLLAASSSDYLALVGARLGIVATTVTWS